MTSIARHVRTGLVLLVVGGLAMAGAVVVAPESYAYHRSIVGGVLAADTTWTTADSPYLVTSTLTIPAGVTLRIEPGVSVIADQGLTEMFLVQGTLDAQGTQQSHVLFAGDFYEKSSSVNFFALRGAPNAVLRLSHVKVARGGSVWTSTEGQPNGQLLISDSVFESVPGVNVVYPSADSVFERNYFAVAGVIELTTSGDTQVTFRDSRWPWLRQMSSGTRPTLVTGNTFEAYSGDTSPKVFLEIAEGAPTAKMDAPANYWRTTDRAAIAGAILDRNDSPTRADVIEYEPVLTEPTIGTPDGDPSPYYPCPSCYPSHDPSETRPPAATPTGSETASVSPTVSTGPPPPAAVTLAVNAAEITAGNGPVLSGRVADADGAGIPGTTVTLDRAVYGGAGLQPFATATTDDLGFYSMLIAPTVQSQYRARVSSVASSSVLVRVHSRITVSSPQPGAIVGRSTTFQGSLNPSYPGVAMGLAVIQNGHYRFLGQAPLGADGTFAITATLPVGTSAYVVYTSAHAGTLYGSKSLTLQVP